MNFDQGFNISTVKRSQKERKPASRLLYIMLAFFSSILMRQNHKELFEHVNGIFTEKL